MGWIILILYIIGAVTAYPRNKKWTIENILNNKPDDWTNQEMVQAIVSCAFLWDRGRDYRDARRRSAAAPQ